MPNNELNWAEQDASTTEKDALPYDKYSVKNDRWVSRCIVVFFCVLTVILLFSIIYLETQATDIENEISSFLIALVGTCIGSLATLLTRASS